RVDCGDDDPLHRVLDLVTAAQIIGHVGKFEPQRLLHHWLLGWVAVFRIRRGDFLPVLEAAERDRPGVFLALANDDHRHLLADRRVGDDARQVAHFLDVLAVELDDHVARFDAGRLGRPLIVDAGDQRAPRRTDLPAFGDLVGHLLNGTAEPSTPGLAELLELIDYRHGGFRGHRKADADRTAGGRNDRGVDADHLAVEVEQRPARVAAIDRSVGLNVVVVGARIDVAVARRDDTGGHRAAETERVADGDDPLAQPEFVRVPEFYRLERLVRFNLKQRHIGLLIPANDLGLQSRAIIEDHGDLVSLGDDVIVGDNDAGRIDDKAGSQRIDTARTALPILRIALAAPIEKVPEQLVQLRIIG